MKEEKLFYCYSKNLCHFLKMNGIDYQSKNQHHNGTYYYIFVRDNKFNDVLTKWEKYKSLFPMN